MNTTNKLSKIFYSIKTSLLLVIIVSVVFSQLILTLSSYSRAKNIIKEYSQDEMLSFLSLANETIDNSLSNNLKISQTLAHSVESAHKQSIITNPDGSNWEEEIYKDVLVSFVESNDETFGAGIWFEPYRFRSNKEFFSPYCMRENGTVTYIDNYSLGDNNSYTQQDWYTNVSGASKNESKWSAPYYDEFVKKAMVTSSTPILDSNNTLLGVATADMDLTSMQNAVLSLNVVANGDVMIINEDGTYIVNQDSNKMLNANILNDDNTAIAKLGQNVLKYKDGTYDFEMNGEKYMSWFKQVPQTNWYIITTASENNLLASAYQLKNSMILFCTIFVVLLMIIILVYLNIIIIRPINNLSHIATEIANGNLNVAIPKDSKNEFGVVNYSISKMIKRLNNYSEYIAETSGVLNKISEGKFKFNLEHDYSGEFEGLKKGILKTRDMLSDTLSTISHVAEQVDEGASQIANASQVQAQGATEQASSIQQLSDMMSDIEKSADMNAESTQEVNNKITEVLSETQNGDQKMHIMLNAMNDMSGTSKEIEKIVRNIEDIAFQTNILALNAAVEAARAGSAGKGFAVVADEVRNLAGKTSAASKETAELIEKTLVAIDNGRKIADETAKSFKIVSEGISKAFEQTETITQYSQNQKVSMKNALEGVLQLSQVVHINSANAEEGAAASEELSAQSQMLRNLVDKFELYK